VRQKPAIFYNLAEKGNYCQGMQSCHQINASTEPKQPHALGTI
jgi:hypothetical protein